MLESIEKVHTENKNTCPVLVIPGEQAGNIMKENTVHLLNGNHHNTERVNDEEIGSHVPILIPNASCFNIRIVEASTSGTSGRSRNFKE